MRSVSRSPRSRRRLASPERRGQPYGRMATQASRIKRSRSHSPRRRGKDHSASRSGTPKRRHYASLDDKRNNQRMEGPCRREADSTGMLSKGRDSGLKDHQQHKKSSDDVRESKRKSDRGAETGPLRSGRKSDGSKLSEGKSAGGDRKRHKGRPDRRRSGSRVSHNRSSDSEDEHPAQSKEARKHLSKNEEKKETENEKKYKAEDQTDILMNKRFGALEGTRKPFVPEENVSIEIERTVEGRAVPFEMPLFWSEAIVVFRRPDEGKIPLTDREEFNHTPEDIEEERRTVKMKKNASLVEPRRDQGDFDRKKHSQGRRHETKRAPYDRRSPDSKPLRLEDERNILRNARDLLISMRNRDDTESRQRPAKRSVVSASQVGRNYLLPAAAVMTGELPMRVYPSVNLNSRDAGWGRTTQTNTGFGRQSAAIPEPQALPDFAHRPDKYKFEEWKSRPELIPKGRSYFEHDDRESAADPWEPRGAGGRGGRSRGGFRGRGRGGFSGPRVGPRMAPNRSDVWRHDKFQELEDSQVPSSTSS